MDRKAMERRIAHLEFIQDQLIAELQETDRLLRQIGFPDGLESVKRVAVELINELREEE